MIKWFVSGVAVLALVLLAYLVFRYARDVPNAAVQKTVLAESAAIQAKIDARGDALEARLERTEAKLDRIESKLDRLLELATPKLPDDMKLAE